MATISPAYTPSTGLASGLDDNELIQSLVQIRQAPITQLDNEQTTLQTQVSELGSIASDVTALQTAVDNLATNGTVATQVTSNNTAFTATAGTQATPGQYSVQVTALATAAKARSSAFTSTDAPVTGGTLQLSVQGTQYSLTITDGESLSDVASALNQLGAPITATILSDGTSQYLEVTNSQTGYPVGSSASSALEITETDSGSQGQSLGLNVFQGATNSSLTVDGLPITETTNAISDVIPGVTLNLSSTESTAENLVLATDPTTTTSNLQAFVTAYNTLNSALQAQLNPPVTANADGSTSAAPAPLSNDGAVLGLAQQMQGILTQIVPGVNGFNSLASIGITASDTTGALSIDQSLLNNALNTNPASVNALFSQATTGIAAAFDNLEQTYADPSLGAITQEETTLNGRIQQMTQQESQMQAALVTYQSSLQEQFANMEQLVSGFKSVGNYLTQLSDAETADSTSGG